MNKDQIKTFLAALKAKPGSQHRDGWVVAACPLAPWRHESGKDKNPSFAVRVEAAGDGFTHCFSCGWHGSQSDLVFEMRRLNKKEPEDEYEFGLALQLIAEAEEGALIDLDFPDVEDMLFGKQEGPHVFPEWWLDSFAPAVDVAEAAEYLASRGVGEATAAALDLRWDGAERRVCFPVRDFKKRLRGLHGRAIDSGASLKYRMYVFQKKNNPLIWLGEHWVDMNAPLVVVESVFDLAAVYPLYRNVVSPLTAGISEAKIKRMGDALEQVTLFDGDKAGTKAREKYAEVLSDCLVRHASLPPGVKDPGEATPSQIAEALCDFVPLEKIQLD